MSASLRLALGASDSASEVMGPPLPEGARQLRDVVYSTAGGRALRLDLYLPASDDLSPVVVWIHGGGWRNGSKGSAGAARPSRARRPNEQPAFVAPSDDGVPIAEIPAEFETTPGAETDVVVGEVFSPGKFFVQLSGEETTGALHCVMKDMDEFYKSREGDKRKMK